MSVDPVQTSSRTNLPDPPGYVETAVQWIAAKICWLAKWIFTIVAKIFGARENPAIQKQSEQFERLGRSCPPQERSPEICSHFREIGRLLAAKDPHLHPQI
jgi:hypothetical protein